jgi:hypothetical protein
MKSLVRLAATCASHQYSKGSQHHVTIPAHAHLKVGTLAEILSDVASYLDLAREQLVRELFG